MLSGTSGLEFFEHLLVQPFLITDHFLRKAPLSMEQTVPDQPRLFVCKPALHMNRLQLRY